MEIFQWVMAHSVEIGMIILGLLGVAGVIAKMTKTTKDDEVVDYLTVFFQKIFGKK